MLTFFTTGKLFTGHSGIIQRNALQSWKLLHPDVEIILFGDETGAAEVARELGIRHEPEMRRHESGLPYISYMFDRAEELAAHSTLCFINCDIILTGEFLGAEERLRKYGKQYLMVGRRWDAEIAKPIDFSNPRWQETVREIARKTNHLKDGWWIDYFLFSRGLYYKQIPDFLVARCSWDNWLVWKALNSRALVVDATSTVKPIHQNHGYAYHPQGQRGVWTNELARRNLALAGGWWHLRTIRDATMKLTTSGLKPNPARYWFGGKRITQFLYSQSERTLIYDVWLPMWHLVLDFTRPVRSRLGIRSRANRRAGKNESTNAGVPS